jgi:predicted DNA-binding transcriptional regulator YafY
MNRRGFLRAAVAAGLALGVRGPAEERPRDLEPLIRRALAERRLLEFTYHDHVRRVEPHALGRLTDGDVVLLAWQVAGGSRSEPPPGWRNFLLTDIEGLELLVETFTPRPDYRPEKTKLRVILAEVGP